MKLELPHMWGKVQDEMVHQKSFKKKAKKSFWFPVKDIKIPDIID